MLLAGKEGCRLGVVTRQMWLQAHAVEPVRFLKSLPMFGQYDTSKLQRIATLMISYPVRYHQEIVSVGDAATMIYLIKSGEVEIQVRVGSGLAINSCCQFLLSILSFGCKSVWLSISAVHSVCWLSILSLTVSYNCNFSAWLSILAVNSVCADGNPIAISAIKQHAEAAKDDRKKRQRGGKSQAIALIGSGDAILPCCTSIQSVCCALSQCAVPPLVKRQQLKRQQSM